MDKRYVDVNVFVYWLCNHPSFGKRAKEWIERIEKEGGYVTSTLTLYETLVIVAGLTNESLKNKEFVKTVVDSIMELKTLKVVPLIKDDFVKSIEVMDTGLDYEDSLHLAVALRENVKEIVSNDADFDKAIKRVF